MILVLSLFFVFIKMIYILMGVDLCKSVFCGMIVVRISGFRMSVWGMDDVVMW